MSEFSHLMKVYAGPMGGITTVVVRPAESYESYHENNALTIEYNKQTFTANIDDLEKAIAVVRNHYKKTKQLGIKIAYNITNFLS